MVILLSAKRRLVVKVPYYLVAVSFCEGFNAFFYYCEKDLNSQDSDVIAWLIFLLISWPSA